MDKMESFNMDKYAEDERMRQRLSIQSIHYLLDKKKSVVICGQTYKKFTLILSEPGFSIERQIKIELPLNGKNIYIIFGKNTFYAMTHHPVSDKLYIIQDWTAYPEFMKLMEKLMRLTFQMQLRQLRL